MRDAFASERREALSAMGQTTWEARHSGAISFLCRALATGAFLMLWLNLDMIVSIVLSRAESPIRWTETSTWLMSLLLSAVSS